MKNLILISALAIGSMTFAQHGKSGNSDKGSKGGKSNDKNVAPSSYENMREANNHFNVVDSDQHGKGDKGNKGGSKGNHGGDFHQKNAPSSHQVFTQSKGNGKKENGHYVLGDKHQKGNGHTGLPVNMKYQKVHSGKPNDMHYGHGKHPKGKKMKYDNRHPNFGYLYINTPGFYSHSNYGHYRSQHAKNKHKHYHPVYEYQAVEGFNFIIVRNNFLFRETENKIVLVRSRLLEQKRAGVITVVEYDHSMQRVYLLEQRRVAVEVNISL